MFPFGQVPPTPPVFWKLIGRPRGKRKSSLRPLLVEGNKKEEKDPSSERRDHRDEFLLFTRFYVCQRVKNTPPPSLFFPSFLR